MGGRPRAGDRRAPAGALRGDRRARRPRRRGAHPRPPGPLRGGADRQRDDTARRSRPDAAPSTSRSAEGARIGPFTAVATPGHAADHFALVAEGACFTGDAVLGTGSVFISPYPGAMAGYLLALTRLRLREDFNVLCPGHGPPVWDAQSKLEQYAAHRIDRENHLIMALAEGHRTIKELLDAVWWDVPGAVAPGRRGDARGAPRQARGRAGAAAGRRAPALRTDRVVSSEEDRRWPIPAN